MARGVDALVKPELLVWARESAGYTVFDAAKKANVNPQHLILWESDIGHPSIPQLRKLANVYKRPIAVFYLPEPPRDFDAMRDFRRLPGEVAGVESPDLRAAIRQAHQRRELALDLYKELEGEPPRMFTETAGLDENTEELGARVRRMLGITLEEQAEWRDEYDALNAWRSALERLGVLVFQAVDVDPMEARGFSISESLFPAVVVNISEVVHARTFTMLHELTHLMLRLGGLCDLDEESPRPPEEQRVEVFCNYVAGATLVPRSDLLNHPRVQATVSHVAWTDASIEALARYFKVGRETLVRRLLISGRTTQDFYESKRQQYRREWDTLQAERLARRARGEEPPGFAPPPQVAVSSAGPLFVRLVIDGWQREVLTSSNVADYLQVRLKHLPKIESAVLRSAR